MHGLNRPVTRQLPPVAQRRPVDVVDDPREPLGQVTEDARAEALRAGVHQRLAVTVADTGQGMSPDFVDNELFAPFATTKGVAGIGVGAYQCREYIRALGGDVAVRSQVGVGTEFTLRLPLAFADSTEAVA